MNDKKNRKEKTQCRKRLLPALILIIAVLFAAACGRGTDGTVPGRGTAAGKGAAAGQGNTADRDNAAGKGDPSDIGAGSPAGAGMPREEETPPEIPGHAFLSAAETVYAEHFHVYCYEDGLRVISVNGEQRYLCVPRETGVPEDLPEDLKVIRTPARRVYMAASAVMSLYDAMGALDTVRLSGTEESGWYCEAAKEAMEDGRILYAGRYSAPDFELLKQEECGLALESTMIYHTPKIAEMIEDLGIPVFVDGSSAESHPLGRTEWILVYGVLAGREKEAARFFEEQRALLGTYGSFPDTGKTAAFFHVTSGGTAVVRTGNDYISNMIRLAGGTYVFGDLSKENSRSGSVNITMEEFMNTAADADYLIYDAAIAGGLSGLEDIYAACPVLPSFRAAKEGHIYMTDRQLYQSADITARMILDLHEMMTDGDTDKMMFIRKPE